MSYLVLARKWRPKTFQDLVGQSHVIEALQGAFDRGRLHHAYLLTGTRGIGKTTIARILAKSFNCETGITATPCGVCSACTQIDIGRFPDMLEIDAASHTGVDNVREILDNSHYLPTLGRYKVYLIDEVHMLSKAAFNAMLKTLEEPPAHIKFILATTDPQKIPPTVLSRCLQFHLRPIHYPQIQSRFSYILAEEHITFETSALTLLAHAAQGSLRDGLSLLDQAIAYGGGEVKEQTVRQMLGVVDQSLCLSLIEHIETQDADALYTLIQKLAEETHNFEAILDDLARYLHHISLAQHIPSASNSANDTQEHEQIVSLAQRLSPETVQLLYQISLHGKRDLALAPDPQAGLTMTLLRMLSFRPIQPGSSSATKTSQEKIAPSIAPSQLKPRTSTPSSPQAFSPTHTNTPPAHASRPNETNSNLTTPSAIPHADHDIAPPEAATAATTTTSLSIVEANVAPQKAIQTPSKHTNEHELFPTSNEQWQQQIATIKAPPMIRQLLLNSAWQSYADKQLVLKLAPEHKHLLVFQKDLTSLLQKQYNTSLQITIEVAEIHSDSMQEETTAIHNSATLDTPAQRIKIAEHEAHIERINTFKEDPFVKTLIENFDAKVDEDSVRPVTPL